MQSYHGIALMQYYYHGIGLCTQQVYDGLPIATNRMTAEEQDGVPHHLLACVAPHELYTVTRFVEDALPVIADIYKRGKVPIIVGGTHYYIEALLFHSFIGTAADGAQPTAAATTTAAASTVAATTAAASTIAAATVEATVPGLGIDCSDTTEQPSQVWGNALGWELGNVWRYLKNSLGGCWVRKIARPPHFPHDKTMPPLKYTPYSQALWEKLNEIDPVMAQRLHPNNKRKICRSLQVYQQHGVAHSQILTQDGNSGETLRFPRCCYFWIGCDLGVLDPRLDSRIESMIAQGLLAEQYVGTSSSLSLVYDRTAGMSQRCQQPHLNAVAFIG